MVTINKNAMRKKNNAGVLTAQERCFAMLTVFFIFQMTMVILSVITSFSLRNDVDKIMVDAMLGMPEDVRTGPVLNKEGDLFPSKYMRNRSDRFDSWFANGTDLLKRDADADGPILDFAIVGFPYCGLTSMGKCFWYLF